MGRKITDSFSENDFEKIQQAIAEAEKGSPGEIVPRVVPQSSNYEEVTAKVFVLALILSAPCWTAYALNQGTWTTIFGVDLVVAATLLTSIVVSTLAHLIPPFKRLILGRNRMFQATLRRAKVSFLDNEVFLTKNRTGILIFVSVFERQVHVLADKGFAGKIEASQWKHVVDLVIQGIKKNEAAEGLKNGIQACGEILKSFSPHSGEDTDELSNALQIEKADA